MKRILFSLFALCGTICLHAQVVSNVRVMQQDTTLVVVYDLNATATTKLQVSFDGGATFRDAKYVSGEIGAQQTSGTNRIAYWNAVKDAGYFDCNQMVFKVIASNIRNQQLPISQSADVPEILTYRRGKVFKDYQNISQGYRYFLKNNSPEALHVYRKKWHGMFWSGFGTCYIGALLMGTSFIALDSKSKYEVADFGLMLGFGCLAGVTGLTLMCSSTAYARKHSVKAYNENYNANPYALAPNKNIPVELRLGATDNGLGLSLHF